MHYYCSVHQKDVTFITSFIVVIIIVVYFSSNFFFLIFPQLFWCGAWFVCILVLNHFEFRYGWLNGRSERYGLDNNISEQSWGRRRCFNGSCSQVRIEDKGG